MTRANENAGRQPGAETASNYAVKHTALHRIKQRAQRLIVGLALWGVLPAGFASWLIRRGGLRRV